MEEGYAVASGFYTHRFHHPSAWGGPVAGENVHMPGPEATAAVVGVAVPPVARPALGAGEVLYLATEPLAFRLLRRPHARSSDAGGFPIDAEYRAQGIGYLAQGGSRPGRLYQQGHQVGFPGGGFFQVLENGGYRLLIPVGPHLG